MPGFGLIGTMQSACSPRAAKAHVAAVPDFVFASSGLDGETENDPALETGTVICGPAPAVFPQDETPPVFFAADTAFDSEDGECEGHWPSSED